MLTLALLGLLTAHEGEMPEPILVESITDLDTQRAGELELEVGTSTLSKHGSWATRLEAEWRVTGRLGLMLEAGARSWRSWARWRRASRTRFATR